MQPTRTHEVQRHYEASVYAAATRGIDDLFDASSDVRATFRELADFFGRPDPAHPAAQRSPALAAAAREMLSWAPAASVGFARRALAHMRYHYGYQAASADYTIRLERLLERMQQRQMDRMRDAMSSEL